MSWGSEYESFLYIVQESDISKRWEPEDDHINYQRARSFVPLAQVSVRLGMHSAALDTPKAAAWVNRKVSGGRTLLPCLSCKIPKDDLGDEIDV